MVPVDIVIYSIKREISGLQNLLQVLNSVRLHLVAFILPL